MRARLALRTALRLTRVAAWSITAAVRCSVAVPITTITSLSCCSGGLQHCLMLPPGAGASGAARLLGGGSLCICHDHIILLLHHFCSCDLPWCLHSARHRRIGAVIQGCHRSCCLRCRCGPWLALAAAAGSAAAGSPGALAAALASRTGFGSAADRWTDGACCCSCRRCPLHHRLDSALHVVGQLPGLAGLLHDAHHAGPLHALLLQLHAARVGHSC